MGPRYFVIVPTYGHFDYAARCVRSALDAEPDAFCLVVDDASPDWGTAGEGMMRRFASDYPDRVVAAAFAANGGLTRSWNHGLAAARACGADRGVCGNSDLLFTRNSLHAMAAAIETDQADLVGPVSNAPGKTCPDVQAVSAYLSDYEPSDAPGDLANTASRLHRSHAGACLVVPAVNGFCMMAKVGTWWRGAYDDDHVFRPRNDFTSKGQRNPTPLMTLNEDELQGRWRKMGLRSGVVPASFVFHFRAVTRGDRYKAGQWFRTADKGD